MIAAVVIVCASALVGLHMQHLHAQTMAGDAEELKRLGDRLLLVESQGKQKYDHAAFEDLKSKVEALRLAQGLKGSRG